MTFNNKSSSRRHGWIRAAAIASLGVAALAATGAAQAGGNVFWSVGVAAPGVQLGVANAPQIYAQPAPVYVQPAPVYYQPAPVYVQPAPVYVQPAPVYYRPARVVVPAPVYYRPWAGYRSVAYVQPGYGYRQGPRHGHEYENDRGNGNGNGKVNGYAYGPVNGNGYTPSNNVGVGYGR
jgi:hypothetical protein